MYNYLPNSSKEYSADAEPADPDDPDHQSRRNTRLAPQKYIDELPKVFIECGCGDCPDGADPLADNDSGEWAANLCDSPRAVTVDKAREIYISYDRSNWNRSNKTSKYEKQKEKYAKILELDRTLLGKHDNLTTVMLTCRMTPTTPDGGWITPWDLLKYLFACENQYKIRNCIKYQLQTVKNIEYKYVRVVAPTESAATPHIHWLIWADDPENEIGAEDFAPALNKFLDCCPLAHGADHDYADDGSDGAITVKHNPPLTDEPPEKDDEIESPNPGYDEIDGYQTRGAQYLASQLAYLPLGDLFDGTKPNPEPTLLEGAAICWMSPYNWFSSSQGV